jgi:hypothetical protein
MKITKEQLNQMIQEELDAYLSEKDEDMDLAFEGEEEMDDTPAEAEGEGDNEELMASLRNLYDVLQGMFGGEETPEDEIQENAGTSGMTVQQLLGKLKSFRPTTEVLLYYDAYDEEYDEGYEEEGPLSKIEMKDGKVFLKDEIRGEEGMEVGELINKLENTPGNTNVFLDLSVNNIGPLTGLRKKGSKVELVSKDNEVNEARKDKDKEDLNESVTINRFKQLANIRG